MTLTDAEIDRLLERFDQTEPALQRRIIARFAVQAHAGSRLAAACRALVNSRDASIYPLSMANRIAEIEVALAKWEAVK